MRKRWLIVAIVAIVLLVAGMVIAGRLRTPPAAPPAPPRQVLLAPKEANPRSVAELTAATVKSPTDAAAWARLGNAQLRARAFAPAIASYRKSVGIDPAKSEVWSAMGEAYIQSTKSDSAAMPAGAREAFDRALALDPRDMRARFYNTMERDFKGEHDEAIGEWLAMLRDAPTGSDADEAIRAAIAASMNRNLALVKAEISRAIQVQPRLAHAPN